MKRFTQFFMLISFLYLLFIVIDLNTRQVDQKLDHDRSITANSGGAPGLAKNRVQPAKLLAAKLSQKPKALKPKPVPQESEPEALGEEAPSHFAENLSSSARIRPERRPAHWERQELRKAEDNCSRDRDCTPRGRDGVLMLGGSFAANQPLASWQGVWGFGNNVERSPLLNMR